MALSKTVVLKDQHSASEMRLANFVSGLAAEKFSGDTDSSVAAKLVNAIDNSIYHVEPAFVVYPRCKADLRLVLRLSQMHRIPITAWGGTTKTLPATLPEPKIRGSSSLGCAYFAPLFLYLLCVEIQSSMNGQIVIFSFLFSQLILLLLL